MSNILDCLAAAPALMPLPGEAVIANDDVETPAVQQPNSDSSTSPRPPEGRRASRSRSLEVVAQAQGDVDAFVEELDLKRRQLDEQIHKFISQKEREFKLFERELRTRYRTPSAPSTPPAQTSGKDSVSPATRKTGEPGPTEDASPAHEKDHERESELLGLFTPVYLPLLESRPPGLDRSPSAPILTDNNDDSSLAPDRQALQRANTDPVGETSQTKMADRLGLGARTPSSGSDPGRSLVSALKSPLAGPRLPKQKRVSLVVGDEVVAPSDNISVKTDRSPERRPEATPEDQIVKNQQPPRPVQSKAPDSASPKPPPLISTERSPQQIPATPSVMQPGGLSLGFASSRRDSSGPAEPSQTSFESEDDIDLASPFTMDEEFGGTGSSFDDTTRIEDVDIDTDSAPESESTLHAASPPSPQSKEQLPFGQSPGLEIPNTRFRSSSSSSAQPTSPGFSRPSVRQDPQFAFADEPPVETPSQGSLYDTIPKPSYSKQQMSGSLGESFMQRNAEEMMRRRKSTQRP